MKIKSIFLALSILFLTLLSCSEKANKSNPEKVNSKSIANTEIETISLAISGMTCEIGCAKTIQSKLSKKEGVTDAKVVFKDSLATIEYDVNKTSAKDLTSFINGIAGGDLYKASPIFLTK
ncbi:MAG: Mercuric transport protein periplasmic component [Flavobacterium sp. SCGC AAA160-P02]|nr:MAG: Mercuric transport protein periplasmic component [Flavobacterium sp. SCGC AAA160-P02]